jgi:hypothetical protein
MKENGMGIVVSMFLIAAGAVMRYAVTTEGNGFNVGTVGMILMVVGGVGAVLSIVYWASWGGFRRHTTTIVRERDVSQPR